MKTPQIDDLHIQNQKTGTEQKTEVIYSENAGGLVPPYIAGAAMGRHRLPIYPVHELSLEIIIY